jgi:hypothetical protein
MPHHDGASAREAAPFQGAYFGSIGSHPVPETDEILRSNPEIKNLSVADLLWHSRCELL